MWHLLPENWLVEDSSLVEVCRVIPGSLIPAQEEVSYLLLPQGRRISTGSVAHLACCHLSPAAFVRAPASQQMPGGFNITYSEIFPVREKAALGVAMFSKEFPCLAGHLATFQPHKSKVRLTELQKLQVGESSFSQAVTCGVLFVPPEVRKCPL